MSGTIRQGSLTQRGGFRLSPNEEAAVLKEERDRRRKLRLKQVREQDRLFAKQLLAKTKAKKEAEVKALSVKLEEEWKAVQTEKQQALKEIYEQCLSKVGDGHREAKNQKPMEEERAAAALRNTRAAKQRHQVAILKEGVERNDKWQKENAHIISRKNALDVERVRASHIANLPPPKRDPLADLDLQKPPVMVTRVEGFSTTHYHIPGEYVERAGPHQQDDARLAAKEEDDRMREETERLQSELRERKEKAVLRHQHAKDKELLKQDYDRLLLELSDLQNADRRRRQAVVADIPRQVFQPPHRRLEDKAEKQHQLEEAFEDMYMKHTDYAGDITLALEPKVPGQDTDLDLTADTTRDREDDDQNQEVTLERPGLVRQDPSTQFHGMTEDRLRPHSVAMQKPVSARAEMLKRLMGKVRGQQDDWKKQQTKAPIPVATGHPQVIQETHVQEEDVTSSPESVSIIPIDTTPTHTVTTTPSELSEHPIESTDNGSTIPSRPRSLETGTLSDVSSDVGSTLLHPMERAARLRGDQLAQQARTQEDIRAIGVEQQKRLHDLQQAVYVPWDNIGLSNLPSVPHYQDQRHMENIEQRVHSRTDFMSEEMSGNQVSSLEPGGSGQAIMSEESSQIRAPGTGEGVEHGQTQRMADQEQYKAHVPLPIAADDTDGLLLMRHRPTVVEETMSDEKPSSESDIGTEQAIDRQLLDEVVHDVPEMTQHTLGDVSSIDWVQRAREYQERLLDRQRQSQDSLLQAQLKLQERRQRLMKNYPDVKLPDYVPYTMQSEIGRTGWQTTQQLPGSLTPVGELHGVRTLIVEGEENRYEPGNNRGLQKLNAYISPSTSSEEATGPQANSHQPEYEETLVGSSRFSPSKRKLNFFQDMDEGARDSQFAPMVEAAVSQSSTEESVNLSVEGRSDAEDVSPYTQQQTGPQAGQERKDRVSHLHETSNQKVEVALKIRHEQLLEEKRVLEERQNAQQLRLMQKQQELANQIEQQQKRYQERMTSANVSPYSPPQHKGPPVEHSPSILQGIFRGSGVGSQSPEMESGTEKSSGIDFGGSLSQHMDMRRMMQGQVFRPQDLLRHLQPSQTMGSEPADDSDASLQTSSGTSGGTQEPGKMMMAVFKPHELLPHLQTHVTDSDGSSVHDNGSLSSSGLIQEQFLRGSGLTEQGTQSFDGENTQSAYQQSSGLSEGILDMSSTASPSLNYTGLGGVGLHGKVFRPADLMAELRAINQEVGTQRSFGSSNELMQSQTGEWRPTSDNGTLSGSNRIGTGSGPNPLAGLSRNSQTATSEQSTRLSYRSSYGTNELSSASGGPKRVYKELLQGHVFRPEDLLPHLQDASLLSNTLDGSLIPEPHLSSTLAHTDSYSSPFAQRHEGDGGGSDQMQQSLRGLSLSHEDEVIQAASPDVAHHEAIPYDQSPVSMFFPMMTQTLPPPGSHLTRSRRPPPANLQQVAMLPENMGPHELSTILETETSADERMHMYGMGATPRMQISSTNERAAHLHFLSGTEGNLGERLPTFGGPATVGDTIHGNQRIQISQPTVASNDEDEADPYHDAQGLRTPYMTSDLQRVDLSVAASTLSEHTLDDESIANVSTVDHPARNTEHLRRPLISEPFGSYGVGMHLGSPGVHRGEPAGESMRWKDLLKSSNDSVTSSGSDVVENPVPPGSEDEEFLPMIEAENTLMTTQDSMQDQSGDASDGTSNPPHAHLVQTGAMHMQKHLAAGLNLDSSSSSDDLNTLRTPRISSQEGSASTSSSSKLSTVIGAVAGEVSSGPITDEDEQATVNVSRSGLPKDSDVGITASQEEYIRDMLNSLQYGRQRGITMPLFSDVSLSGYSMSQDGSTSEIRTPVKPIVDTSDQVKLPSASYLEDQMLQSLSDLQMETGIMEEPELTFASSLNTTADSLLLTSGFPASQGRELPEPAPLDMSVSSQTSISMSLLSFQQHEQELLDSSPQAPTRVTRSEGHLKVNQSTSSSSTLVRGTQSEGQLKDIHQTVSLRQSSSVKLSEGHIKDSDGAAGGPVSLQEAFQQRKKAFIKASETRKKEVKDHAESRSQEPTAFAKTIQDWKRSKIKVQKKPGPMKKGSKSKPDSASGLSSTMITPSDRNASQKETKERTQRLYNQLEEVKRQKAEKERQDSYAANRQKKKEYEQKLQAKRLKRTSSLEKTKKKDK